MTNSSSKPIPKERQSAYQRWELASLHRESVAANEDAARRNELEAEAAGTRTQARADGYAAGLDMTRRDLQAEAKKLGRPWEVGKSFDYSAPCSRIELYHTLSCHFVAQ